MHRAALILATGFGVGYVPVAPGKFGSMLGLVVWALLPVDPLVQALTIAVLFAVGSWAGTVAEAHFGATDPGPIVLDEVIGMLITLFVLPVTPIVGLLGFLVFRIADIVKPYPSNRLERLPGGIGVMADDAMAAVYAHLAVRALLALLAWAGV
jgi:phosphatidylglycerophosphatase A